MDYCPDCGGYAEIDSFIPDVATTHTIHKCKKCHKKWEATSSNGIEGELISIKPILEGEDQ